MIKEAINKLIFGYDLSSTDVKEVFDEILSGLADDILTSSFVTALKVKGETDDEITAAILASRDSFKKFDVLHFNSIENISFLQNDNFIDISFAMDVVLSASGVGVVKYLTDDYIDFSKSFLTFKNSGANNFEYSPDLFEKTHFAYFKISPNENYIKYSRDVFNKLCFNNIFTVINRLLNPLGVKNQFIGVDNKENVERYANICLKLNNDNTIVLSGNNNFSYASVEGDTFVAEAWKNKIFTYVINPELVGLKCGSLEEIKCENSIHGLDIIRNVFQNKLKNVSYDAIVLNSALALYISKHADSIMDGILIAKKTIDSGLALEKLNQISEIYS